MPTRRPAVAAKSVNKKLSKLQIELKKLAASRNTKAKTALKKAVVKKVPKVKAFKPEAPATLKELNIIQPRIDLLQGHPLICDFNLEMDIWSVEAEVEIVKKRFEVLIKNKKISIYNRWNLFVAAPTFFKKQLDEGFDVEIELPDGEYTTLEDILGDLNVPSHDRANRISTIDIVSQMVKSKITTDVYDEDSDSYETVLKYSEDIINEFKEAVLDENVETFLE